MTFRANKRPLFSEISGPIVGLKEEWTAQSATPGKLDFSAFRYRRARSGSVPVNTGWLGGEAEEVLEETEGTRLAFIGGIDKHVLRRSREEITAELEHKTRPMVRTGRCMLGVDHRIPNGATGSMWRRPGRSWSGRRRGWVEREAPIDPYEPSSRARPGSGGMREACYLGLGTTPGVPLPGQSSTVGPPARG